MRSIRPQVLRARTAAEPEPDLTSMLVIHRAIRQDLRRLATRVDQLADRGVPLAQAGAIRRYGAALLAEIRAHYQNEEDIIWPVIAATAGQSADLTPLTDDHRAIEAEVARARLALAAFSGEPGAVAELRGSVGALRDMLDEHITDEEEQILPVMRRYLSAGGYRWCEQQARRKALLPGLWFTLPWLARYARPDELRRLLGAGGWPVRILLPAARPGYARLERQAFGRHH